MTRAKVAVAPRLLGLKLRGGLGTGMHRLYPYRPRFRDKRFWYVQIAVLGIAAIHAFFEISGYFAGLGRLYFVPISLLVVPVAYAALHFGFIGSVATALWVVIISIPNVVLWHSGLERGGEMFQMAVLITIAIFMGHRVDREREARRRAQAYASHIVRGQEQERQRIARDLHDETIQSLILVCRQLDSVKESSSSLPPQVSDGLHVARSTVEQIVIGLRDFAKALRPPTLDDLGIVASIRRMLIDFTERTKVDGELKVAGKNQRLPPDVEVGMFRIAQEALWNVERHARATRVTVTVAFSDRQASLTVLDNGVGFTIPTTLDDFAASGKLGYIGMRERAELLGGRLEIQSSLGTGTRVSAIIPLGVASPSL